jgi:hypothetical protein
MNSRAISATLLCALAGSPAVAAAHFDASPYGPGAPAWNAPPDWTADLPADGGRVDRPPGLTDIDAWLRNGEGHATYRLRQRPARNCFTRPRGRRCLVRYSERSFATGYDTTRYGARVYGWAR